MNILIGMMVETSLKGHIRHLDRMQNFIKNFQIENNVPSIQFSKEFPSKDSNYFILLTPMSHFPKFPFKKISISFFSLSLSFS